MMILKYIIENGFVLRYKYQLGIYLRMDTRVNVTGVESDLWLVIPKSAEHGRF